MYKIEWGKCFYYNLLYICYMIVVKNIVIL